VGGWTEARAEIDLRVGGQYRFTMRDERGAEDRIGGIYTELERPERLGFTWTWEDEPSVMRGSAGSLVEVVLRVTPEGTRLDLVHSELATKLVRKLHQEGWNALLTRLFVAVC
jgi:uncharacterized protein YndB with AHSA1/START domain